MGKAKWGRQNGEGTGCNSLCWPLVSGPWPLALRLAVGIVGFYLIASFPVAGHADASVAALSIVAFVIGGIRISLGSASGEKHVRVDSSGAIAFGAALACGPFGAAAPAAMAALGAILLGSSEKESLWNSVYRVAVVTVMAAAASLAFVAAGGDFTAPLDGGSVAAALAAAAVYVISDRILRGKSAASGCLVTLGFGYAIAGAARVFPPHSVLIPGLPVAIVLLWLLRDSKTVVQVETEEAKEEPEAKPSLIDPTTGLANQRYLEMFLHQEISRADRSGQPVTVLLIDIDDFASINEAEGSETGDRCMISLGAGFKQMVREYDVVARYNEDEFVIVLPEADAALGGEIARRLHSALSGQALPARARFSVGVATYPAHGASIDSLIASAHHALNRAKFSGKNTVICCDELAKAS